MIGAVLGTIKGLGAIQKLAGLASWIPGVGVLPGIISSVLGALAGLVRLLFEGVTAIVSNPAALVTALVLGACSLGFGFKQGLDWSEHKVALAYEQVRRSNQQIKSLSEQSQKAAGEKRTQATEAAQSAPQPETPSEIAALCQRSASCREKTR